MKLLANVRNQQNGYLKRAEAKIKRCNCSLHLSALFISQFQFKPQKRYGFRLKNPALPRTVHVYLIGNYRSVRGKVFYLLQGLVGFHTAVIIAYF